MRSLDAPSRNIKRGSSPLKEDGENATVDSRSVQHKKAKFKSPLSTAHATISENRVVSSYELSTEVSSDGVRKRVFGTDASNAQPPTESRNNVRAAQTKSKRSCSGQNDGMPGFAGILEDVHQICPASDVKIQSSEYVSDHETNTALQPKRQDPVADNTVKRKVKPSGSTLEDNSRMEGDEASVNLRKEALRLSANAVMSMAATKRSSIYSKFKMPARVRSVCEAQEVSETTPNVLGTLVRPQLLGTPYRSSTIPIRSVKATDSRATVGEKTVSDYYCVMYCIRKPNAKHKGPWSDGVLIRRGRSSILQDTERKVVLKDGEQRGGALPEGATLLMGKFEVEVMRICSEEEFLSGKIFQGTVDLPCNAVVQAVQRRPFKSFQAPSVVHTRVSIDTDKATTREVPTPKVKPALGKDALVLNAKELHGGCFPVIVDPYLALKLRPHQRGGVKFMYECVMGLRNSSFTGCLLADAMGLGKTLQVIALIWTLIKQGPGGHPAVRRVLVICPSSLVENWGKEVRKWLGNERLPPLIIHSGTPAKDVKRKLSNFQVGKVYHLLITSYELLRKHKDDLNAAKPGLLVCDEAHRLKNCAGNKTIDSLLELNCSKRLILTGTPIQNDLLEFYAMIDFVNPNLLGTLSTFKRFYADPIEKSRDRDASENEKILGRARSAELQSMTRFCILQRAANVNAKYLPAKTEYVVFCMLQTSQVSLYQNFLKSKLVSESLASGQSAFVLSAIGTLRKLCNHPMLVEHELSKGNGHISGGSSKSGDGLKAFSGQPNRRQNRTSADWRLSGKLLCLQRLLLAVHRGSTSSARDKMVVVSNFTQTLDIIQIMCEGQGWRWLRLDGATNVSERQALVDRFNASDSDHSVFLLSSKAGGSGLNLIGANRLVLFDPDWNPATDAQAMARVWRDGQKKPVFIYRLLTTASIEEKIYQRQIMKGEVAAAVEEQVEEQYLDGEGGGRRHFSREELRELFTLNLETSCDTFDLLSQSESSSSDRWRDYSNEVEDHALKEAIQTGVVTFVYQKTYVKDILSPLDSIHEAEDSKLEEDVGGLDTHQPHFSSFPEVHEVLLDCEQKISDQLTDNELNGIIDLDREHQPTNSTSIALSKKEIVKEDWDSKTIDVSSAAPGASVDKMIELLGCDEQIANPIYSERKSIIRSRHELLAKNCWSSLSSKIESNAEENCDPNKRETSSMTDNIGDKLDDLDGGSLAAKILSTEPERVSYAWQNGNAKKHYVQNDEVDKVSEECDEQAASQDKCQHKKRIDLEDERPVASNPSRAVSKSETNSKDERYGNPDTNSEDISPAPTYTVEEVFDCLLESRSQKILQLMVNLSVPEDELDEDELEVLDAPFLCSLDLEIEMKRASFSPEDLWQGLKLFAIGFLLEEEEQRVAYRNSKLGLILDKCNLDKTSDAESKFCKGFPMVRAVLNKRDGCRAADLPHLFGKFEREEYLNTTFSGRFTLALMRQLDRMQMKRDEHA